MGSPAALGPGGLKGGRRPQKPSQGRPSPPSGFGTPQSVFDQRPESSEIRRQQQHQGAPPGRPDPWASKSPSSFFRHSPPPNRGGSDNPLVTGDIEPELQFFGPSDFVPTSSHLHHHHQYNRYERPMQEHGPGKLRYMSASDFPNVKRYGLIPIPRR